MDGCGVHARPASMLDRIGMLEILEDEIELRDNASIGVQGREAARFDGEMEGCGVLEQRDQVFEESGLEKRFAAGEGDAAAGGLQDVRVLQQFRGEIGGGTAPSTENAGALRTPATM